MTYSLPFGLTQKPTTHVFENGEIRFSMRDSVMHFEIIYILKKQNFPVATGMLESKAELDYLLNVKEFPIRMNADMTRVVPL